MKKRREPKSCDACRRRRIKCDQTHPVCLRCSQKNFECSYLGIPKKCNYEIKLLNGKVYKDNYHKPKKTTDSDSSTEDNENLALVKSAATNPTFKLYKTDCFLSREDSTASNSGVLRFSPPLLGVTMLMYTHYNSTSKFVIKTFLQDFELKNITIQSSPVPHIYDQFGRFISNSVVKKCIKAYFDYYHPYTILLNKDTFLKLLPTQPRILVYLVCAVGASYLRELPKDFKEYYSDQALQILKRSYLKPSYANVASLILFCTYHLGAKYYDKANFYSGLAIRMSYALGLDQDTVSGIGRKETELRRRLWLWCHITDKLFYYGIDRPCVHDFFYSTPPRPTYYQVDIVDNKNITDKVKTKASMIYNVLLAELCQLKFLMASKFKFVDLVHQKDISSLEKLAKATGHHLDLWNCKLDTSFSFGDLPDPKLESKIVAPFLINLRLLYYSALVQLYQTFAKLPTKEKDYFKDRCKQASAESIELAEKYREIINLHGNVFRFYALSNVTLYQTLLSTTKDADSESEAARKLVLSGVKTLEEAEPYFPIAGKFKDNIKALLKADGINVKA